MKSNFLFETKLFAKNPKNKLMFLVFVAFLLLISFLIFVRNTGNIEDTQYQQMNTNRIAISTLSEVAYDDPELSEFYDRLYDQQQLVARQEMAVTFEEDELFVDTGIDLSQLQIEMHDYIELDELAEDVQMVVPSLHQAETDQAFFSYVEEESIPIMRDRQHASGFLITFFEYFGLGAFIILLLFSCSIISSDLHHQTMVKGYPLSYEQKTSNKIIIYTIASFLSIVLLTVAAAGIIALVTNIGPFDYPMIIYQGEQYGGIPILGYAFRYFIYLLVLSIHVISLSALLNTVTKNMYATLFIGLFVYSIPTVVQFESALWQWVPVQFYNTYTVLSGEIAYLTGQPHLSYLYGIASLLIWSVVFLVIVYAYQKMTSVKNETESSVVAETG